MTNKNYINGANRERRIMKALENKGMTCLRTRGSHGFVDVIALDQATNIINFIQVKPKSLSVQAKTTLQSKISWVERNWVGKAQVISLAKELK